MEFPAVLGVFVTLGPFSFRHRHQDLPVSGFLFDLGVG